MPVRELIQLLVLGEPLVDSLQEPMPAEERLEYAIQATAVIWEALEQMRYVVSDDVDSDSVGMAPWDAGGMHGNDCQRRETFWTMMLQWLIRLLCRPVIRNGLVRTTRMNTEYGLDQLMMTNMDSPRLAVTSGEWYASDTLTPLSRDLSQMNGIPEVMGAMYDCRTGWDFPQFDSTAVELDDLTFRRPSFPPKEFSAGGDTCGVVMLDTVHIVVNIFRWIWASTLLFTTWNLCSCGAARLCGVRYGRGLLRTVLIICGVHTGCRYQ